MFFVLVVIEHHLVGSLSAIRACLANPACKKATLRTLKAEAAALENALGIGADGALPDTGMREGPVGIVGSGILDLGRKLGGALSDMTPGDFGDGGGKEGTDGTGDDSTSGDQTGGGDDDDGSGGQDRDPDKIKTPESDPDVFQNVRGRKGKRNLETGGIWEFDWPAP